MDSSKIFGVAEECHSSESGWTMYIGSPIDGDSDDGDDHSDHDDYDKYCNKKYYVKHDNDSDDSMASDASSGPSRREYLWVNGHKNQEEEKEGEKHYSCKKGKNPVEKNRNGKRKGEKEESPFAAKGANITPIQSGEKVKKNSWFGKRK
ncbi:protein SOB FIVE-LIKE 4-like [Cornus florida]|uniref:protein SOB FIVE-LIKE 4-like n=1 Tax=Cornus florida TaxID=4283 RepID=UPI00289D2C8E|nr:protein SOB FIVE-LIKE 4-like [Cornus florida]